VAVAMRDGSLTGLQLVDNILAQGDLSEYHLAHAARADLCRRLGNMADAKVSYRQALAIARQEPERRFLEKRLAELGWTGHQFNMIIPQLYRQLQTQLSQWIAPKDKRHLTVFAENIAAILQVQSGCISHWLTIWVIVLATSAVI
jgi:hypothetical protein